MEFHLFFCQRSFHIRNTKTLWKYTRAIQLFHIFVEIHRPFHITHLLIISQSEHRLQCNIHILILHTSTIITCIALFSFRIISYHYLPIVIHILIWFLTGSIFIIPFTVLIRILVLGYIFIRHSVLFIQLSLQEFKFILFSTLPVPYFLSGFSTLIISGKEIRVLVDNSWIILYSSTIISRLCTKQTTIKDCHHIIRLHFYNKVEIFNSTVLISYPCTQQTTVIVPDKIIRINIQCQVIITHGSPQVILMKSGQCAINIIPGILSTQMNSTIEIRFRFPVFWLLQLDDRSCCPCVRIVFIQFKSFIEIIQCGNSVFLL